MPTQAEIMRAAAMPTTESAVQAIAKQKARADADDMGLPPPSEEQLRAIADAAEKTNVYGVGYQVDRAGNPIPQGIGSPGHETLNHFSSIRRYQGEAKYQAAVRKIWKENAARAEAIGLEKPERISA